MIGLTLLLITLTLQRVGPAEPDSIYTLAEVRVAAERARSEARRRLPTAFVTELRTGVSGRALEPLSEVLSQAAGVRILQYGGLGSFSTVSLRGAPANQVTVYLDGVPLTSAAHGIVNLADLPATAVERVEVYRGLSPLGLGVATPGGAINLVTVSSPDTREAHVAHGSFDTWEGRATAGAARGPLSGLIHAGYQATGGSFRFWDDNATPAETGDDGMSVRVNNRFGAATALTTVELRAGMGIRIRAREDFFRKAQGVPGLGANPALHPRLVFARSLSHLEVEREGGRGLPDVRISGALQREWSRFRDPEGKLGFPHDTDDALGDESFSLGLQWARLPAGLSLEAGVSHRLERAELHDAADGAPDPPRSHRSGAAANAGIQLRALGERVIVHAAERWDRIEDRLHSSGVAGTIRHSEVTHRLDTPQLGLRISGPRGLELRANWTDARRVPGFLELFGNQGSVLGNPALVPERGENHDVGLAWSGLLGLHSRAAIEWAHFDSQARDLIVYLKNSPSTVRAQNISRARIQGEELSLRWDAPRGFAVSGSITWQTSVDQGSIPFWRGRRLPQRPERQSYARLDWAGGRLGASAELFTIGENFLDRSNRLRAASRALIRASLSFAPLREKVRLVVEGKNLGDDRVSDVGGFPLPGRSFYVSCRMRLGPPPSTPP